MLAVTKDEIEGVAEWAPVAFFTLRGMMFETYRVTAWLLKWMGVDG